MAWILFGNENIEKLKKIIFLIEITPYKINSFNFENS
jgi:hypothetical protein